MSQALDNINVLVTRPEHQAETLCALIEQQGGKAICFPTLQILPVENKKLSLQLETMGQPHWLIFVSANAVNFAFSANNGRIERFKNCSIAAVGKATAKALHLAGLTVDLIPDQCFDTEGLLATEEMQQIKGKNCLIIRGQGGRETLAECLLARGAKVEYMEVYSRAMPVTDSSVVQDMLRQGEVDMITITSGDALKNLVAMIGTELHDKLQTVPLIVISNRIRQLAEKIGFKTIVVTDTAGDTAMIETMVMMRTKTQQ